MAVTGELGVFRILLIVQSKAPLGLDFGGALLVMKWYKQESSL